MDEYPQLYNRVETVMYAIYSMWLEQKGRMLFPFNGCVQDGEAIVAKIGSAEDGPQIKSQNQRLLAEGLHFCI